MKICIVNGSPKADNSITLQTSNYIQQKCPGDEWTLINVGAKIKYYENHMDEALELLNSAELVIFSYPVYTFMAPYQLHRFIELLKENKADFSGKHATQITTSKHFYDITAHGYVKDNCIDLGFRVIDGLSADMNDLLEKQGREDAIAFWKMVKFQIQQDKEPDSFEVKNDSKVISIVTNAEPGDETLKEMIKEFQAKIPYKTNVYNILEADIKGGCISCFHCAPKGECIYKDDFQDLLRNKIQKADATVYAFTIKDHSMGASFKKFDDRQFCNGHRTVTMGKPVGYIVNGDYAGEKNLQTVILGRSQVGHNYLPGVATDSNSMSIMCTNLEYALENNYIQPQNFYGVGGMTIFRDLIYIMGGLMRADYQFYKEKGFFKNMPHRQQKTRFAMRLVGGLFAKPNLVKKMGSKVSEGMMAPYKKVLDEKK